MYTHKCFISVLTDAEIHPKFIRLKKTAVVADFSENFKLYFVCLFCVNWWVKEINTKIGMFLCKSTKIKMFYISMAFLLFIKHLESAIFIVFNLKRKK